MPMNRFGNYLEVFKSKNGFDKKMFELELKIIFAQLMLLILFFLFSYRLAKNALYIEDNGNGIEELEKIFERSYSEKHSSGIGLDIIKRLAKSMNIEIKVESSQKGAIFILTMS